LTPRHWHHIGQNKGHLETLKLPRAREVEAELSDIRHLAILLAKTAQLQGAQALPPSDHAVWAATGALGGVQHTLDVVMSHLKVGSARVWRSAAAR
jgi:hypothetical protein